MKRFSIKAGERHRILHLVSDSLPQTVRFSAAPAAGPGPVRGLVEVVDSRRLFKKPPKLYDLQPENAIRKGMSDTHISVYVTPEQDADITLQSRHLTAGMLYKVLAALVILAVLAVVLVPLVAGG